MILFSEGASIDPIGRLEASIEERATSAIGRLWEKGCDPEDCHVEVAKSVYPRPCVWPMDFGNISIVPSDNLASGEFRLVHVISNYPESDQAENGASLQKT